MEQLISHAIGDFVNNFFRFESPTSSTKAHKKYFNGMITGILGSRSTVIANIAGFLNEPIARSTEDRLCKMLSSSHLPWDGLRVRSTDMAAQTVQVRLPIHKTELTVVIVHDPRNEKPVVFLTTLAVHDDKSTLIKFGFYLEKWG